MEKNIFSSIVLQYKISRAKYVYIPEMNTISFNPSHKQVVITYLPNMFNW